MHLQVSYLKNGNPVGHPDRARSIQEARLLAPEGRLIYGADMSVISSVDDEGNEKILSKLKV